MEPYFVDTHCHLYLNEFKEDIHLVMERAHNEGINKFYMPAIDSHTTNDLLELEKQFPGKLYAMMGLHPCSVKENYEEEIRFIEQWFRQRTFAAVGEIGLDYYWDRTYEKEQISAFHQQIELALYYDRPIVVHSRNAMYECIEIIKAYQSGKLKGIFHCFTGTLEQANLIIDAGLYLGIGGVITYKNAGLAEIIPGIALDHIVLETDAPYLSPVPYRGKRNESSYLKYIIQKLAEVKNTTLEEVRKITTMNAQKIFDF